MNKILDKGRKFVRANPIIEIIVLIAFLLITVNQILMNRKLTKMHKTMKKQYNITLCK